MEHSMKKLIAIVALGTVLATPAFAQQAPDSSQGIRGWQLQGTGRVHPYAAEHYQRHQQGNSNMNPDFQLGGER
jgi:opacity protein-like surface antigen